MPFVGLGLHVLIALFFAVHAVRSGRELYWLLILFMFPLLGSVVYFFAVYLPDSRLQQGVRKAVSTAAHRLDPGRELREARQAFDLTPTAQNEMRLAKALLEAGETAQAVEHYEACLTGPFAKDPEIGLGAARARLENGQADRAIELLSAVRADHPERHAEQVALRLAQAYARLERVEEARAEFVFAVSRFGSTEAHAEYAIWAFGVGDLETANAQYREIESAMAHWSKHAHALNKPIVDRLEAAFAAARKL